MTGTDTHASRTSEIRQDVDLDRDDLLGALVLDADFEDIADVHRSSLMSSSFSRDVDLDEDDVFAALVLGNALGGHGLRDLDDRRLVRLGDDDLLVREHVFIDLDGRDRLLDDDFRFRTSGFGTLGGFDRLDAFDDDDLFDIDASSSLSRSLHRDVDLDEDDVLAALILS